MRTVSGSIASLLQQAGASSIETSKLVGHVAIATTADYTIVGHAREAELMVVFAKGYYSQKVKRCVPAHVFEVLGFVPGVLLPAFWQREYK